MRPVKQSQSALRAPLNEILGKETHVRLLRALAALHVPAGPGELAMRAELEPLSVRRALARLVETGVVERVGAGARAQYQLRRTHPLAPALEGLFAAERGRVETLLRAIRSALETMRPQPRSAWAEGLLATGTDGPGDAVGVGVLLASGPVRNTLASLRAALAEAERSQDVTLELRGYTPADVEAMPETERQRISSATPLFGLPPAAVLGHSADEAPAGARSHARHDEAAKALAEAVAARLAKDPSLVRQAQEWIARRLADASPREREELREWEHVLSTMSIPRLRRFLADPGERATRLRQTLPFVHVLTPAERDAILAAHRP